MIMFKSNLFTSIPSLFAIGFYGSLADKYGRKVALLLPVFGSFLYLGSMLLATHVKLCHTHFAMVVIIGALFNGLSGGPETFLMATFCYASDMTSDDDRTYVFSVLQSTYSIAKIIGPLLVGLCAATNNFSLTLSVGVSICLATLVWVVCFVHESLPGDAPTRKVPLIFDPLQSFRDTMRLFGCPQPLGSPAIPFLFAALFDYHLCATGLYSIEILFQKYVLRWTPLELSLFGSINGMAFVVAMLVVPGLMNRIFEMELTDIHWIEISLWVKATYFMLFGFVSTSAEMFSLLVLILFCGSVGPRARALLSKHTQPEDQSTLFVGIAAAEMISTFLTPGFSFTYAKTVSFFPGFVYEVGSVLLLVGVALTRVGKYHLATSPHFLSNRSADERATYTSVNDQEESQMDQEGSPIDRRSLR